MPLALAVLLLQGGLEVIYKAVPEEGRPLRESDLDRSTADGKASSVQFVHFDFTPAQIAKFRVPDTQVIVGVEHPWYGHMAVMPEAVRQALAEDFST